MKTVLTGLMCLVFASTAWAQTETVVHWKSMVGVITAQGVDNPVADIDSGTFAWSARGGKASVNLDTWEVSFEVQGLVINGTAFSGTPGPVTAVTGTLVCNAGDAAEAVLDTPAVSLGDAGNALFSGSIGPIPSPCANPLFLIRIAVPAGAAGRWIATGASRVIHSN